MSIKMPKRWFRAQSSGRTIRSGLMPYDGPVDANSDQMLGGFRIPPFQREVVWTDKQSIELIDSLWNGFPIGSYTFNTASLGPDNTYPEADHWLLDGQQRWTAIVRYLKDEFRVHGGYFSELDRLDQKEFMGMTFPANETRNLNYEECLRVYNKLAYGGTAHEPPEEAPAPPVR